jgi:recombinational DNA repair protein (RecF pathway)
VTSCAECGADEGLVGYSARAGGAVCPGCRDETTLSLGPDSLAGIEELLRRPLSEAHAAGLDARAARDALAVVNASHEYHGGFRLRTLSA